MQLYDLTDPDEMAWLAQNGYIREVAHSTEPLHLLNYTDKAQIDSKVFADYPSLNHCRGLIYNTIDGSVVARPFRKFWNHGQAGADQISLDASVIVTDKVDGSLGILYRLPSNGQLAIATRGSFTSDQAIHATDLLRDKYRAWRFHERTCGNAGETLLFEIIYPGNRIVVDNGDQDDLVLLGSVEIETGIIDTPAQAAFLHDWAGPRATSYVFSRFADVLAAEPRPNAEGYVVRAPHLDGDAMVKIKQEDYLLLHKIVFGLSERSIWEALGTEKTLDDLLEPLPDEFHAWVIEVSRRLVSKALQREAWLRGNYVSHVRTLNDLIASPDVKTPDDVRGRQKLFAELVRDEPDQWAMFALHAGKDIGPRIWKDLKPEAGLTPARTPKVED
jgi:RNA ligase